MPVGIPKGFLDPPPTAVAIRVPPTAREQAIALFTAGGFTTAEIASRLEIAPRVVIAALAKEEVRALVEEYRSELMAGVGTTVDEQLTADTPRNLRRLQQIRDQDVDLKAALAASRELFSRQVPVHTVHHEDRVTRVIVQRDDMLAMREAVREIEGVVVQEVLDGTPSEARAVGTGGTDGGGDHGGAPVNEPRVLAPPRRSRCPRGGVGVGVLPRSAGGE